jgi:uncharacterized protein (UPF0212 family)
VLIDEINLRNIPMPDSAQIASAVSNMLENVKFLKKDVTSGKCAKVGDTFTAFFMIGDCTFTVVSHHGDHFFASIVE